MPGNNVFRTSFLSRFITMFSLSQAGATPGVGLQLRGACCGPAGSGRQHINLTVGFLFMRFFRIAGFRAQAALRLRGVGAKPNGESILTLRLFTEGRSRRRIGYLQPGSRTERHRASAAGGSGLHDPRSQDFYRTKNLQLSCGLPNIRQKHACTNVATRQI